MIIFLWRVFSLFCSLRFGNFGLISSPFYRNLKIDEARNKMLDAWIMQNGHFHIYIYIYICICICICIYNIGHSAFATIGTSKHLKIQSTKRLQLFWPISFLVGLLIVIDQVQFLSQTYQPQSIGLTFKMFKGLFRLPSFLLIVC